MTVVLQSHALHSQKVRIYISSAIRSPELVALFAQLHHAVVNRFLNHSTSEYFHEMPDTN